MLVLSRNKKQVNPSLLAAAKPSIRILKVTVLQVCGGTVRLGFDVDNDIPVHRAEVWDRIHGIPLGKTPAERSGG